MKQIAKSAEVLGKLRAAYGPDANLDSLAVFETTLMNTKPIRKDGGLFMGARIQLSLLNESAAWVNRESVPVNELHGDPNLPAGRLFFAEAIGEEARGLFAIDETVHPALVASINSGTVDQVSVGQLNKSLACNKCGFNFLGPESTFSNIWEGTCDKGHTVGVDGTFVFVDGLKSFFELTLCGMGAVDGARIVGPSDAKLINDEPLRLAASASKVGAVRFTCSTTEDPDVKLEDFTAQLTAATTAKVQAETQLSAVTAERDAAQGQLTGLQTQLASVTTERDTAKTELATATTKVAELSAANEAALASASKAKDALVAEATVILTACGKTDAITGLKDMDIDALLATTAEHRAAFAAAVPVGGAALSATRNKTPARASTGAFQSAR